MNPEDLARILDELGQRLGPSGAAAFASVVTQKVNEAQAWIGFYSLASSVLVVSMALLFIAGAILAFADRKTESVGNTIGGTFLAVFLLGVPWAFAQYQLIVAGLQLQNPTYYALRDILSAVNP